jgi:hypothetical protein
MGAHIDVWEECMMCIVDSPNVILVAHHFDTPEAVDRQRPSHVRAHHCERQHACGPEEE